MRLSISMLVRFRVFAIISLIGFYTVEAKTTTSVSNISLGFCFAILFKLCAFAIAGGQSDFGLANR